MHAESTVCSWRYVLRYIHLDPKPFRQSQNPGVVHRPWPADYSVGDGSLCITVTNRLKLKYNSSSTIYCYIACNLSTAGICSVNIGGVLFQLAYIPKLYTLYTL